MASTSRKLKGKAEGIQIVEDGIEIENDSSENDSNENESNENNE